MSYSIESITESIGARRMGNAPATIDWLLTDSRSLNFPEETLFFALTTKRNGRFGRMHHVFCIEAIVTKLVEQQLISHFIPLQKSISVF